MDNPLSLTQRIYEMLMESQFWPPEQMLVYQRGQLAQLLRHAKATVPFYKTRLDVVFKKNGEIDWDRWQEIPIVTRADLRDRREQMLTTALPPGHGPTKTFHSSGSSGVPVSVEVTKLATLAKLAAKLMMGKKLRSVLPKHVLGKTLVTPWTAVKEAVLPWTRFPAVDAVLGLKEISTERREWIVSKIS